MNINTLANELPDYVTGDLPVSLIKNSLVSNGSSFYAITRTRKSLSQADIANDLIVTGNNENLSASQIMSIWNNINAAVIDRVANACTVDIGLGTMSVKVLGSFESENEAFNREKHSLDIGFRASKKVLSLLSTLKVIISMGHSSNPEITKVTDLESGSNDKLTPNGFLNIEGTNLTIAGDDEKVGLYFKNTLDSSKDVKLAVKKMGVNNPSKLACVVPQLEAGTYQLKIITQFSKGKAFRKVPLESNFSAVLTVE